MSYGTVAIIGRSNVGKSTFLNRVLGEDLAIVSPLPQTTRDTLLGVVSIGNAQLAFLDTPGVHQPKSELGRRMNAAALEAARGADLILFMSDVAVLGRGKARRPGELMAEDAALLAQLSEANVPCVLAINKVDLLGDKSQLLPLLEAFSKLRSFSAMVPISMLEGGGVDGLLKELARLLPEGPKGYADDTLTDRPMTFFAREYVREQVLLHARAEVPHAVAVTVDRFEEQAASAVIGVTLHVEKVGQRKILIGRGGAGLRAVREGAQARIGALLGKKTRLELFVRVTPRWKNVPRQLAELGYEARSDSIGAVTNRSSTPPRGKRTRRARK